MAANHIPSQGLNPCPARAAYHIPSQGINPCPAMTANRIPSQGLNLCPARNITTLFCTGKCLKAIYTQSGLIILYRPIYTGIVQVPNKIIVTKVIQASNLAWTTVFIEHPNMNSQEFE